MHYLIMYLAEDPETGNIIDGAFVTQNPEVVAKPYSLWDETLRKPDAEREARQMCMFDDLNLLDYDGPYVMPFWPMFQRNLKPKWNSLLPPGGIDASKWAQRGPKK